MPGGLTIRPQQTDLRKTLDDIIFMSSHLIGQKDLELLDETGDLPNMMLDDGRIQQVFAAMTRGGWGVICVRGRVVDVFLIYILY